MQRYDVRSGGNPSNTTFALAQFLATTGPDEYVNHHNVSFDAQNTKTIPANKINLFERLRKKTSHANTKYIQQQQQRQQPYANANSYSAWASPTNNSPVKGPHKKYIPLIDDINQPNFQRVNHQQLNYAYEPENNTSNHASDPLPSFPTPPASSMHESLENHHPQESSSSSSASETSSAPRNKTTTTTRADPSQIKKNPIRGLRHMQVQTEDGILFAYNQTKEADTGHPPRSFPVTEIAAEKALCPEDKDRCELCTRPFNRRYLKTRPQDRRASCPAVLASGAKIQLGHEATVLLALIEQLKQQLNEEQKSRKLLEKTIQSQWLANK